MMHFSQHLSQREVFSVFFTIESVQNKQYILSLRTDITTILSGQFRAGPLPFFQMYPSILRFQL